MAILTFLKKPKVQGPFTETTFEYKRGDLTIRGTEYRPEGEDLSIAEDERIKFLVHMSCELTK